MIVTVFIRRLRPGRTFADFVAAWEAEVGFGVPTRVLNAQSLEDPRDIISIGFVDIDVAGLQRWMATGSASEAVRHDRIDEVIESTTLRCTYELRTEHDLTTVPHPVEIGGQGSLFG